MKRILTILTLLLTVAFLSWGQDIKPISPLFKNLQSPSFSFMIGGNPWIYKGSLFNPNPWTELAGWTNVKDTLTNYWNKIDITPSDTTRWGTGGTDISGKEDKVNKENTTVSNDTIKYPTVNLLKTYADTKDPSSTNELNTSVSFNTSTNDLSVIDAGGTKTANIAVNANLLINGYSGTINVTTNPVVFNWPVAYSDTNYYLDIFPHYTETIGGKSVLIRNAVYDFTKTTTGFSLKLDTLAGVVEYRASRTINSETPANVLLQSDLTTTVGTPGLDTKIPTEKAVRTAIAGFSSMVYPSAGIPISTGTTWSTSITDNHTNWDKYNQWDGGSTGLVAATGRTSLGATTIGGNLFVLTNPSAITFPRFNADNTISPLSASDFKTAIGGGVTTNSQIIKFDTGTTEGTDLYTFNGSEAKTVDIKAGTNITLTKTSGSVTINSTATGGTSGIWTSLTGTYASATTFTFSGTDTDAKLVELSLFTCTNSTGATRRIGYVKTATNASGTITCNVVTDTDLASGDKDFKIAYNQKVTSSAYQRLITIPGECIADASFSQGMYYADIPSNSYLLPVDFSVQTAAAGTGAALTINIYKNTTALFSSAPDMTTNTILRSQRPTTNTITAAETVSLRITSSAGATNKAAGFQAKLYIVPVSIYSAF